VSDLVRTVLQAAGSSLEPEIQNPSAPFEEEHLDNSKAHKLLGWTPRYDLPAGLRETIAWFRDSPQSPLRSGGSAAH
jgi:nucleoside-diphosphate-sugar epimerase